jgi:hypothetical protein
MNTELLRAGHGVRASQERLRRTTGYFDWRCWYELITKWIEMRYHWVSLLQSSCLHNLFSEERFHACSFNRLFMSYLMTSLAQAVQAYCGMIWLMDWKGCGWKILRLIWGTFLEVLRETAIYLSGKSVFLPRFEPGNFQNKLQAMQLQPASSLLQYGAWKLLCYCANVSRTALVLGALRIKLALSLCPCVQLENHWRDFHEILCWGALLNLVDIFQLLQAADRPTHTLYNVVIQHLLHSPYRLPLKSRYTN